jgi:hypothetical protein
MDCRQFESVTEKNNKSALVSYFDWWGLFL